MRIKFFLFLCLIFSSFNIKAQGGPLKQKIFSDLKVTNSITKSYGDSVCVFHVAVLDDQPVPEFTKRYFWFHQGEMRSTQGQYTGKLLHGAFEKFDRNGTLLEKGNYDNGLKQGEWLSWYTNGTIQYHYKWSEGLRVGDFEFYDQQGRVSRSGRFRRGKLHGKVYYYFNGVEDRKEKYRNGQLVIPRVKKLKKSDTAIQEKETKRRWFRRKEKKDSLQLNPQRLDKSEKEQRKQKEQMKATPSAAPALSLPEKPKKKKSKQGVEKSASLK